MTMSLYPFLADHRTRRNANPSTTYMLHFVATELKRLGENYLAVKKGYRSMVS